MKFNFFTSFMISALSLCALSSCGEQPSEVIVKTVNVSDKTYVHPLGRTLVEKKDNLDMLYFANSCSGFSFDIDAESDLNLTFSLYGNVSSSYENQYARVYVDGDELETLQIQNGVNDYTLENSISKGKHKIKLLKLNEPAFSQMGLLKIHEGDYSFKEYENEYSKKIEFYGDSITCGYGNLTDNSHPFSMETEDGAKAYTQLCADKLGYENSVVSYSGIAMALSPFNNTFTMLDRYKTVDGYKDWDFSNYVPDAIVINIGTNDNTKLRSMTGNDYVDGINKFYANLREMTLNLKEYAPNAKFIFAYNMMLTINDGLATCMESVCRELNEELDNEIAYVLEFTPNNKGADGHPSVEGHENAATVLADFIESIM